MPASSVIPMDMRVRTPISLWAQWCEDVGCVFARDPAARGVWQVLFTAPGVQAMLAYRLAHRLWMRNWRFAARLVAYLARTLTGVEIHPAAQIGRRCFIDHGSGVVIGETAEMGEDCTLYHGVTLGGVSLNRGKRHPTLGDRVVVGAGAKILGPILLENDVRVGANSVVIRAVPAGHTVVGIPARSVRMRDQGGQVLSHNELPDPLGRQLQCLSARLEELENALKTAGIAVPESRHCAPVCEEGSPCKPL